MERLRGHKGGDKRARSGGGGGGEERRGEESRVTMATADQENASHQKENDVDADRLINIKRQRKRGMGAHLTLINTLIPRSLNTWVNI